MTSKILLAATALTTLSAMSGEVAAQPVSGIYIGAGAGANFEQRETTTSSILSTAGSAPGLTFLNSKLSRDTGGATVASVGYGFGNGIRVELEGDYRYNRINKATGNFVQSSGGREQKYGPMFNVLFDMDIGSPYVFPYIGGGAGYQWEDRRRATANSRLSIPEEFTSNLLVLNSKQLSSGVDSSFAYQAMAGFSFPIPRLVGLSLTAEYRFFALAGSRSFSSVITGQGSSTPIATTRFNVTDNFNHSLLIGLRYAFNVAPPPTAEAPASAVTETQAARTYLVFFDWDRADLTDRARQIVTEAAQATTRVQVTRIEVSGHTDTTGTAGYNQGLSVRRAQNVAAELVRLGVPRASITTQGFGFSRPLVATGPGVREPQNRRVEIILR